MKKKIMSLLFSAFGVGLVLSMKSEAAELKIETSIRETLECTGELAVTSAVAAEEIELIDAGYCGGNVMWGLTTDGILVITGSGNMKDYGNNAPWNDYRNYILGVVVSGDVKHIGNQAFRGLDALLVVHVEEGVRSVGEMAFYHCDSLQEVKLANSITEMGASVFLSCQKLTTINIPSKLKVIPRDLLSNCASLTAITIPNGVTEIGEYAFSACPKLKSVKIPNTVKKIGYYAFAGCKGLTSISIPKSVEVIDSCAFVNCGIKNLTIPSGVTTIWSEAFEDSALERITIADSVTYVGYRSFRNCKNLKEVYLSNSITMIEWETFENCTSLKTVRIPSKVTFIDSRTFAGCVNLTTMRIPANVEQIGTKAFENCKNLKTISIMNPNVEISEDAFENVGKDLLIRCLENSTAQEFAIKNNYNYELIDISLVTEYFDDVYPDWYKDYVQYVYDNGLMTGMKGTTEFKPNANVTKAQVAQVLYNMAGQPEVTDQNVFTELKDVYAVEWYADAVAWAYNEGVVTGDTNARKFYPNADVTREQLALMMYRYAAYQELDATDTSDFAGLKHAENVSNWAEDGVRWAVGSGLISGIDKDGVKDLAPQGNATRAQMAAILQRFCEKYNEKQD